MFWKVGHCRITYLASFSSENTQNSHHLFDTVIPFNLASSHLSILHLHTILTITSQMPMCSGYLSNNSHHTKYMGVWHKRSSRERLSCNFVWIEQKLDWRYQAHDHTDHFQYVFGRRVSVWSITLMVSIRPKEIAICSKSNTGILCILSIGTHLHFQKTHPLFLRMQF